MEPSLPHPLKTTLDMLRLTRPTLLIELDPPLLSDGHWFVDIRHGTRAVVLEWQRTRGLGVSQATEPSGFGEKPEFPCASPEEAVLRTLFLLDASP